jgi:sugar phosphate isomerase/epimerase
MTSAPAGCDATPDAKVRPPFGVGVNLPWRRYGCDFGTNAWRLGGLTGHDMSPVRRALAAAAEAGARVVRWFVLCDGRAGIDFSPAGWPLRLQPAVLDDMGRAIALAGEAGLQLVPVLFDFHLGRPATQVRGVQLGGRHALIRDPVARQAFVAACVDPLVRAFGRDARIACWDLCNEPEWLSRPTWPPTARLPRHVVARWLGEMAQRVRWSAAQPVTVGLATARGLPLVDALGLDLVQVHWYDRHERRAPLSRCPAPRQRCPVVLGEFPSAGSLRSPAEIIATARAAGYAGAWGWSLLAADSATDAPALLHGLKVWNTG